MFDQIIGGADSEHSEVAQPDLRGYYHPIRHRPGRRVALVGRRKCQLTSETATHCCSWRAIQDRPVDARVPNFGSSSVISVSITTTSPSGSKPEADDFRMLISRGSVQPRQSRGRSSLTPLPHHGDRQPEFLCRSIPADIMSYLGIASDRLRAVNRRRVQAFHCNDIVGSGGPDGGPPERVQQTDKPPLLPLGQRNMDFPRSPQAPEKAQTQ